MSYAEQVIMAPNHLISNGEKNVGFDTIDLKKWWIKVKLFADCLTVTLTQQICSHPLSLSLSEAVEAPQTSKP